jgi:glycosyltransferase involved in cell wall biosynthesis
VLVIDDCSSDDSAQVGAAIAAEDRRVEFRRHESNKGHIATYNEGIEWASGDYLLLLSADDLATPGALTRAAAVLDANPNAGMTYGKFFRMQGDSSPAPLEARADYKFEVMSGRDFFEKICRAGENFVPTPTAVVRTRTQKLVGGYNPALPHAGDMEMWLRFALRGDVAFIDIEQAHYRFHTSNMHLPFFDRPLRDLEQRKLTFQSVFDSLGAKIQDAARLHTIANKSVAREAFWVAAKLFDHGNVQRCDEVLQFATGLDPDLVTTSDFSRLQWKRRLGSKVWPLVMPVIRHLRGQSAAAPAASQSA